MGAPALIDAQGPQLLQRVNDLTALWATYVRGGAITDGGTTQASGANATFNLDLDVAVTEGAIDNVPFGPKGAGTDIDAEGGTGFLWGATSGRDVTCAVVLHTGDDGTTAPAFDTVLGAVAATGASVAPTEAEIDEALGHSHWVLVGMVVFSRTADTTVTVTPDYTYRASLGHKVSPLAAGPSYTRALAESEAEFRDYGA